MRELHNLIERAAILARGDRIRGVDLPDLGASVTGVPQALASVPSTLEDVERAHIVRVLGACNWTLEGPDGAARTLGTRPSTLRSRMAKLGIRRPPVTR